MKRLFDIAGHSALFIFVLAGVALVVVGYATYNLLNLSMANLAFLRKHGLVALSSGGLVQLVQIVLSGTVALTFFLVYKICESELILRYRRWIGR
jgi:hypothetical protein